MPHWDYAFIHPLLGPDDEWSAFLLETSPGTALGEHTPSPFETADFAALDKRLPWLVSPEHSPEEGSAGADRSITCFALHETPDQPTYKALEARLRQAKRKVAALATPECRLPATGAWDYLLISAAHARSQPPFTFQGIATRTVVALLDVHTYSDRDWALGNACTLTTGEFLLTRTTHQSKADMTRMKLLKLLTLIDDDANTQVLEAVFREESKLSYNLLRLVNSAAVAPPSAITSYPQAINLLGRRQLQRWLQLLVFSDPNNGQQPTPLLQKAARRGHLMESLLALVPDQEISPDTAFITGTLSVLDVLLNTPMGEILNQLP